MKLKLLFAMLLGGALSAAAQGGYQDGVDNYNAGRLDVAKIILENTINDPQTNKSVSYYYLARSTFRAMISTRPKPILTRVWLPIPPTV